MQFPEHLSTRIRELRLKRRLSQTELERLCKFNRGALSRLEPGDRCPSRRQLETLSDALETPLEQLLQGTDYGLKLPAPPRLAREWLPAHPPWIRPEQTIATRYAQIKQSFPDCGWMRPTCRDGNCTRWWRSFSAASRAD